MRRLVAEGTDFDLPRHTALAGARINADGPHTLSMFVKRNAKGEKIKVPEPVLWMTTTARSPKDSALQQDSATTEEEKIDVRRLREPSVADRVGYLPWVANIITGMLVNAYGVLFNLATEWKICRKIRDDIMQESGVRTGQRGTPVSWSSPFHYGFVVRLCTSHVPGWSRKSRRGSHHVGKCDEGRGVVAVECCK